MFEKLSVKSLLAGAVVVFAVSIVALLYFLNSREQHSFAQQMKFTNLTSESIISSAFQEELSSNQLRAKVLADSGELRALLNNTHPSSGLDSSKMSKLLSSIAWNISLDNSYPEVSLHSLGSNDPTLTLFSNTETNNVAAAKSSMIQQVLTDRKPTVGVERLGETIFITVIEPIFEKDKSKAPHNILGYVRVATPLKEFQKNLLKKEIDFNWIFLREGSDPFRERVIYSSNSDTIPAPESASRTLDFMEYGWQLLLSKNQRVLIAEIPFSVPLYAVNSENNSQISLLIWKDISAEYLQSTSYFQKLVLFAVGFLLVLGGTLLVVYHVFHSRIEKAVTYGNKALQGKNNELKSSKKRLEGFVRDAEQSNDLKSSYLAAMTHEIRTPMNAVIGTANMLVESGLNDEQSEYANTLLSSGETLLAIVDDILDYSKIEANRLDIHKKPLEVAQCIEESLDQVSVSASNKGLELDYLIDETVPHTILGDHARLRQILINLLSNAVKFTPKGEVELLVHAKRLEGNIHQLSFHVSDSGIGIPGHKIRNIFDRYSHATRDTETNFGGTGLGLTICKRLSKLMGGDISVQSVVNKGSTFSFTITGKSFPNQSRNFLHEENPNLIGRCALIVDDNEINRKLLAAQTKSWGMTSLAFSSALDALAEIEKGSFFDFALLDFRMPVMDGGELADKIMSLKRDSTMPLILLSSAGPLLDKKTTDKFSNVLAKPIKPVALYNILLKLTGQNPDPISKPKTPKELPISAEHPLSILVAEDNPANLKVIEIMLRKLGYLGSTTFAENGQEALDAISNDNFDVVFMDIQMPLLNGYDATRKIRQLLPEYQCPRIVALTASAMKSDREKALNVGMDDFIAKPIRYIELKQILLETPQKHQFQKQV